MQEKIKELLENHCSQISVHFPTLDEKLQPKPQLLNQKCPKDKDGQCATCEHFMGYMTEDDGAIFSYSVLNGFCLNEGEDRTEVITELNKLLADYEIQQALEVAENGG